MFALHSVSQDIQNAFQFCDSICLWGPVRLVTKRFCLLVVDCSLSRGACGTVAALFGQPQSRHGSQIPWVVP